MKVKPVENAEGKPMQRNEFLATMVSIFEKAKYFGIPTYGGKLALLGAVAMLLMLVVLEIFSIWKLIRTLNGLNNNSKGSVVARLSGTMFYANALLSMVVSWRIVHNWKDLHAAWVRSEDCGLHIPPDGKIRGRVIFVTSYVTFIAIVEHALSMISETGFDYPPGEFFESYILGSHGFLLQKSEYSLWAAIPIFILSKLATVLWNFQDLIIILMSLGLASKYNRLNLFVQRVVSFERKMKYYNKLNETLSLRVNVWRCLRLAYTQQALLVRKVDQTLGALILLSNLNNLFFICLQLFLGIGSESGSLINRVYYFFSLAWLLYRASSVVLAAADVNIQSKKALPFLYNSVSGTYNVEIKRLTYQIKHDEIALSGLGFFYLYRGKLLEVAAAVIKYELILLQFDKR